MYVYCVCVCVCIYVCVRDRERERERLISRLEIAANFLSFLPLRDGLCVTSP